MDSDTSLPGWVCVCVRHCFSWVFSCVRASLFPVHLFQALPPSDCGCASIPLHMCQPLCPELTPVAPPKIQTRGVQAENVLPGMRRRGLKPLLGLLQHIIARCCSCLLQVQLGSDPNWTFDSTGVDTSGMDR